MIAFERGAIENSKNLLLIWSRLLRLSLIHWLSLAGISSGRLCHRTDTVNGLVSSQLEHGRAKSHPKPSSAVWFAVSSFFRKTKIHLIFVIRQGKSEIYHRNTSSRTGFDASKRYRTIRSSELLVARCVATV